MNESAGRVRADKRALMGRSNGTGRRSGEVSAHWSERSSIVDQISPCLAFPLSSASELASVDSNYPECSSRKGRRSGSFVLSVIGSGLPSSKSKQDLRDIVSELMGEWG